MTLTAARLSARIGTLNRPGKHYKKLIVRRAPLAKVFLPLADLLKHMLSPVSNVQADHTNEAAKAAAPKPQPAQQPSTPQPSDKVTLKSTDAANNDGDSK